MKTIKELAAEIAEKAKSGAELFFANRGTVPPIAIVASTYNPRTGEHLPEPSVNALPLDIGSDQAKEATFAALRFFAKTTKATVVAIVTETWIVQAKTEEIEATLDAPLSAHPDRKEALCVMVETADSSTMWSALISRDPDRIAPWETGEGLGMSGFVTNPNAPKGN
jgi:hypothetical protein